MSDALRRALLYHDSCLLVRVGGNAVRSVAGLASGVAIMPKLKIAATHEERTALAGPRRFVASSCAVCLPAVKELDLDWTQLEFMIGPSFLFHVQPFVCEERGTLTRAHRNAVSRGAEVRALRHRRLHNR
jgi:hypothetical protein